MVTRWLSSPPCAAPNSISAFVAPKTENQVPDGGLCPLRGIRAFSLLVYTEQTLPTWLFLKKSRTSRRLTVQSRSENALVPAAQPGKMLKLIT